jgi:hypothetical protein
MRSRTSWVSGLGEPARLVVLLAALMGCLWITASASAASSRFSSRLALPSLESLAPTVTNVSPGFGPLSGGTPVAVVGTNLTGATEVDFGGAPASFTVKSSSKLEAISPPGSEGTVDVTVTAPEGTSAISSADQFVYVPPGPVVLDVKPSGGPVEGGKTVKVDGAHFDGATEVSFGGSSAAFEVVSSEELRVVTPPGSAPTVDVRVTTPEGISPIRPADEFVYQSKTIEISGASPKAGPAAGGNSVLISGKEFYGITGIRFGTHETTSFTVDSPDSITAVAPPSTAERIEVQVESTFGPSSREWCVLHGRTVSCSVRDFYKYLEPTVTKVTPSSGPAAGGTTVTLTGTGFGLGETETKFDIGKALATSVDCSSITTCTAVIPPAKKGKAGAAAVIVSVNSNEPAKSKKNGAVAFVYE